MADKQYIKAIIKMADMTESFLSADVERDREPVIVIDFQPFKQKPTTKLEDLAYAVGYTILDEETNIKRRRTLVTYEALASMQSFPRSGASFMYIDGNATYKHIVGADKGISVQKALEQIDANATGLKYLKDGNIDGSLVVFDGKGEAKAGDLGEHQINLGDRNSIIGDYADHSIILSGKKNVIKGDVELGTVVNGEETFVESYGETGSGRRIINNDEVSYNPNAHGQRSEFILTGTTTDDSAHEVLLDIIDTNILMPKEHINGQPVLHSAIGGDVILTGLLDDTDGSSATVSGTYSFSGTHALESDFSNKFSPVDFKSLKPLHDDVSHKVGAVGIEIDDFQYKINNLGELELKVTPKATTPLYGVTGDGADVPETFYAINDENADKSVFVKFNNGNDEDEAIAFNPDNGLMYHMSGLASPVLETVNLQTKEVNSITLSGDSINGIIAMVYDEGNSEFILADSGADLHTMSATGVVSNGPSTDHAVKGMAFKDGTLYTVSKNDDVLRTINPTTGATLTTQTMTLTGFTINKANGLSLNPDTNTLYALLNSSGGGPTPRQLVSVNESNGVCTDVGSTGDAFAGIAYASAPETFITNWTASVKLNKIIISKPAPVPVSSYIKYISYITDGESSVTPTPPEDISGTFTIGTGGDYPSLSSFVNFIDVNNVVGNITGTLISDITETEKVSVDFDMNGFEFTLNSDTLNTDITLGHTINFNHTDNGIEFNNSNPTNLYDIGRFNLKRLQSTPSADIATFTKVEKLHDIWGQSFAANTGFGIFIGSGSGSSVVYNIGTYNYQRGFSVHATMEMGNCTDIESTYGFDLNNFSPELTNCAAYDNLTAGFYEHLNATGYNNASSDGTAANANWSAGTGTGVDNLSGLTTLSEIDSVNPLSPDFARPLAAGSVDTGGKTYDGGSGLLAASTADIAGVSWDTPPSIGVFQYV